MYEYEKYVCTKETLKQTLQQYGVAIIPNVLDEDECNHVVDGVWDFLEHITKESDTPLRRDNPNSWREFYKLYPLHSMLLQHYGVGHAQVSWDVRQNRKIVDIFSHFWKCKPEDLLVSFDGLSFNLPPEKTNKGWFRNTLWYHTDQSFLTPEFQCIQSWVSGLDVNENDATLAFLEGSHVYHSEFQKRFNVHDKKNWYKLSKKKKNFIQRKDAYISVYSVPRVVWYFGIVERYTVVSNP